MKAHQKHVRGKLVLVIDGASTHNRMKERLVEEGYEVVDWPAYSPDFNLIETLWAIGKCQMRDTFKWDQSNTKENLEFLKGTVIDNWKAHTQADLDKLLICWNKRLRRCIDRKGEWCQN